MKMTGRALSTGLTLALLATLGACGGTATTTVPSTTAPPLTDGLTIAQAVAEDGRLTKLTAALEKTGLAETLSEPGSFTLLAPTDEAFSDLPQDYVDELFANPDGELRDILLMHVLPIRVTAAEIPDELIVGTLGGNTIQFAVADETLMIDGATIVQSAEIVQTDIEASNGVIHVIDTVLLPVPTGG